MSEMTEAEMEVREVADAIQRSISLTMAELPATFFPAHLSVALISAICGHRSRAHGETVAKRYCRRFDLEKTRGDRRDLPPADRQEMLKQFVGRFDDFGMHAMAGEVLEEASGELGAETVNVLRAARALLGIGVAVLQALPARRPAVMERALRTVPANGARTARRFLMYAGEESFVLGDGPVRRFVASALGRRTIAAHKAERLVRAAAYELILPPRLLDCRIWEYAVLEAEQARSRPADLGVESMNLRGRCPWRAPA